MTKKKKPEPHKTEIKDCTFTGIQFDPRSAEAFKIASEALKANAEATKENAIACQVILKKIMGEGFTVGAMLSIHNGQPKE